MKHGASIINLPPDLFTLTVDQLLPVSGDGSRPDALDFACLRLSSRGMRQLYDASVRRLDLRSCSGTEMRQLLRRFKLDILSTSLRLSIRDESCSLSNKSFGYTHMQLITHVSCHGLLLTSRACCSV
jgi:hypothetical protein